MAIASSDPSNLAGSISATCFSASAAIPIATDTPMMAIAAETAPLMFIVASAPVAPNKARVIKAMDSVAAANFTESVKVSKNIDPANNAMAIATFFRASALRLIERPDKTLPTSSRPSTSASPMSESPNIVSKLNMPANSRMDKIKPANNPVLIILKSVLKSRLPALSKR